MKFKSKSAGKKLQEHNVGAVKMFSHSEATHILDGMVERYSEQPEVKEKKIVTPAKKVIYIAKNGKRATFDSMKLVALVFGVNLSSVRARLNKPTIRRRKDDWLKGGRLEYINN